MTAQTQPAQPAQPEALALAERLEDCAIKYGEGTSLGLEAYSASKVLRRLHAENEQLRATNSNLSDALAEIASGEILRSHCIGPHCTEEMGVATADELSSRAAGALDWEKRAATEAAHGIGEKTP